MKKWLMFLALAASILFPAAARALMVATSPAGETLTLTEEKADCPSGETPDGYRWDARQVIYHDPRDGEHELGCYIIDARDTPVVVVLIFKSGSLAGQPVVIEAKHFKPEI